MVLLRCLVDGCRPAVLMAQPSASTPFEALALLVPPPCREIPRWETAGGRADDDV